VQCDCRCTRIVTSEISIHEFREFIIHISTYLLQIFKANCAIWLRSSNFRHQVSPRVSPRDSTQRRKVELWERNFGESCLNAEFHVTFKDLLHAVKLRHVTNGFTAPPKDSVLMNFRPKYQKVSAGCEPANLGNKVNTLLLEHRSP